MVDSSGQQQVGLGGVEVLGGVEEKERRGACCEGWEEEEGGWANRLVVVPKGKAVSVGSFRGCICHACSHMGCYG